MIEAVEIDIQRTISAGAESEKRLPARVFVTSGIERASPTKSAMRSDRDETSSSSRVRRPSCAIRERPSVLLHFALSFDAPVTYWP